MIRSETDQKDCSYQYFRGFSCSHAKTPKRSDGLSYPLILYGTTHLCKLPNRPGGLFYPLALLRFVYLLHELPNRPDGIIYSLALSRLVRLQNFGHSLIYTPLGLICRLNSGFVPGCYSASSPRKRTFCRN